MDDGSCTMPAAPLYGCMDQSAQNYDPQATHDDGSCTTGVVAVGDTLAYGCTDTAADNYDSNAMTDDGSCVYGDNKASVNNVALHYGCTDQSASNYDSLATMDDGS